MTVQSSAWESPCASPELLEQASVAPLRIAEPYLLYRQFPEHSNICAATLTADNLKHVLLYMQQHLACILDVSH